MFTPSGNPKELTINLYTVTDLNPPDQLKNLRERLVGIHRIPGTHAGTIANNNILIFLFKKSKTYVMYLTMFCLTFQAFVQLLWSNRSYMRIMRILRFPVGRTCDLCYQSFFSFHSDECMCTVLVATV